MDNIWRPVDPEPRDDIVFLESLPTKNLALEHIAEYLPKDMVYLVENMINSTEREDRLIKKFIFWMCCPTAGCVAPWDATVCKRWHESTVWNFLREGLLPTLKFRSGKRILIRARFQATIVPYCEAFFDTIQVLVSSILPIDSRGPLAQITFSPSFMSIYTRQRSCVKKHLTTWTYRLKNNS